MFPSLPAILESLMVYVTTPVALPHLDASGRAVGGALILGALTSIPLGIICGSRRSWLEVVEPLILYAAVLPKIVIFPIFILDFAFERLERLERFERPASRHRS